MTDILEQARAAVLLSLVWTGDEPAEPGSCVEVLRRMIAYVERLRAALEPFAVLVTEYYPNLPDIWPMTVTLGDCRAAKKALEEQP